MKKLLFIYFCLIGSALAEPVNVISTTLHRGPPSAQPSSASVSTMSEGLSGAASHAAGQYVQHQERRIEQARAAAYANALASSSSSSTPSTPLSEVTRQHTVDLNKLNVNKVDVNSLLQNTQRKPKLDLNAIPDPGPVPYRFQSAKGELVQLYTNLYKVQPQYPKQQTAKAIGLQAVEGADQSYASGDLEAARLYHEIGVGMLDIVIGLDPVTGVTRSAYEFVSGKNMVTGVPLSKLERTFAFVGVVTAGQSRNVQKVGGVLLKVAGHAPSIQPLIHAGEKLAVKVGEVAHGFMKSHRITQIEKAIEANIRLGYKNPPYDVGSRVVHFVTTKETKWVRVHTNEYPTGRWLVKAGEIKGLTPQQIADKLNLPSLPTHYNVITLPKDTAMTRGMTHLNQWETGIHYSKKGQVQYRIEAKELLPQWYGPVQALPTGGIR